MSTRPTWIGLVALGLLVFHPGTLWAQDPRGTVPPPGSEKAPGVSPRETGVLTPPPRPDFQAAVSAAIGRFEPAYAGRGSPRIAVYWNRQLSDRLSDWESTDRVLATDKRVDITQGLDPSVDKSGTRRFQESESGTITQRMGQEGRRGGPGELWEWEFQSGFLDPFMRAGARIVDRTAILRITASRATSSLGRPQALDAQPVEMDALQGHADLFVEVLLSPSPQMPSGQEFLAVVKDVNTGQILAHVNSRNAMHRLVPTRDYVATSRGFEPRDTPPHLRDLASNLAINVMDALGKFWAR